MSRAAVEILDPGLLATVQDAGRRHVGGCGVSPSGFADFLSARAANRLVGNAAGAALIETTMTGMRFLAATAMQISVTGAEADLHIDAAPYPLWHSVAVAAGCQVAVGPARRGLRSYVAFAGGLDVSEVLGSASTDTAAGIGGPTGRPLVSGDRLCVHEADERACAQLAMPDVLQPRWSQPAVLGVTDGPHTHMLAAREREALIEQSYRVSHRMNRQGIRLEGQPLVRSAGFDVLSTGVCAGCVQVASDGLPIVLLADHQTTGGYALVLAVIFAHQPDAAQLKPGDLVRFRPMTQSQASVALTERTRPLTQRL